MKRRDFLKIAGTSGAVAALPHASVGCSDSEADKPAGGDIPSPSPKEPRTIHFDLSHTRPELEHTLHLGGKKVLLKAHTVATRNTHRQKSPWLQAVPDAMVTHYIEEHDFPADAVQTYYVTHKHPKSEIPMLSTFGIHIPQSALGRASAALYAAKAKRISQKGGNLRFLKRVRSGTSVHPQDISQRPDTRDLADFADYTDAAMHIVFHHPELISLDPDVVTTVLEHIQNAAAFFALVESIQLQGQAQSVEDWEAGYQGFSNGQYLKDLYKEKLPDGKGGYRWTYIHSDETLKYMRPVIQQALKLVRNDATLKDKKYSVLTGIHAIDGNASTQTNASQMKAFGPFGTQSLGTELGTSRQAIVENTDYKYKLDDEDWKHGRKIEIKEINDRDIKFGAYNSYFRHLGVHVRFLDVDHNPIALSGLSEADKPQGSGLDMTYAHFLGVLPCRLRLLGIPLEGQTEAEYEFKFPADASFAQVLCSTLGCGDLSESEAQYEAIQVAAAVMTGVIDLAIPTIFLACGVAISKFMSGGAKILASVGAAILEWAAGQAARGIATNCGVPGDSAYSGWAMEVLATIMKEAVETFAELFEFAAEAAAEEAAEESVPVVGLIILAVNIAGGLAEIIETVAAILLSPWVTPATISATMDINVEIHHDVDDYQFPASAYSYKVVGPRSSFRPWLFKCSVD